MRTLPILLLLTLFACSAAPPTEVTGKTSEAIDPTHTTTVPILTFEKLPPLPTTVLYPTLPHGVVNEQYLKHLPGIIWALGPTSTEPLYKPCGPAFQTNQDLCYSDYTLNTNECDIIARQQGSGCQIQLQTCQSAYCTQQVSICYDEIPDCLDSSCLSNEQAAMEACVSDNAVCDNNISPDSLCASQFDQCINAAEGQDASCKGSAQYYYQVCSNQVGLCI